MPLALLVKRLKRLGNGYRCVGLPCRTSMLPLLGQSAAEFATGAAIGCPWAPAGAHLAVCVADAACGGEYRGILDGAIAVWAIQSSRLQPHVCLKVTVLVSMSPILNQRVYLQEGTTRMLIESSPVSQSGPWRTLPVVRKNFIRAARVGLVTCDPGRSMSSPVSFLAVVHCLRTLSLVAVDLIRLVALAARPRAALVAENLFLRKQLALFQERKVRPRRADAAPMARKSESHLSRDFRNRSEVVVCCRSACRTSCSWPR